MAGRLADPALPAGEVRVGGFGGVDGLRGWLDEQRPDAVAVDATHPFAAGITANAAAACAATGTRLLRLQRPGWTAGPATTGAGPTRWSRPPRWCTAPSS